ncbi:MAG: signal peptidase II [Puniceicoccales bacterium]|jgi:signal peptidase II|nr:signal peptidase II [Puniceicoccales bacterium]
MSKRNNIIFNYFFIYTLFLDQGTKFLAEQYLQTQSVCLSKWLTFSLSHNTGCAWSLFQNNALVLGILGILFVVVIFWKRSFFGLDQRPIVLGLLLGGILGNLIDRFSRGFVIDFIDINLQIYHWPTFNVADCALCLVAVSLIFPWHYNRSLKKLDEND